MPRVHRVGPVHVARLEVSLGVREAPLSHTVVLAHDERVVERSQCCLVLLPPQMFGRLRTHGSGAADQGHCPHFAADGLHSSLATLQKCLNKINYETIHFKGRRRAFENFE